MPVHKMQLGIRWTEWVRTGEHRLAQPLWFGVAVQGVHCVGWRLQRRCRFVLALGSLRFRRAPRMAAFGNGRGHGRRYQKK